MKFIARIFLTTVLGLLFAPDIASAAYVNGLDTVAGFGTVLEAKDLSPDSEVLFQVINPDNSQITLKGISGRDGKATVDLGAFETRMTGKYQVLTNKTQETGTFEVFPADLNPLKSAVYADKQFVAANGFDSAKITVRAVDDFLNPMTFREIKLISSRSGDRITPLQDETDQEGLASFLVSSNEIGRSIITAFDTGDEETLGSPISLMFLRSPSKLRKAIGGDSEQYQFAASLDAPVLVASVHLPSDVKRFEIKNLPASVSMNEAVSFTIEAVNDSGQVVPVYNGQITFSATDANAALPNPYLFQASDQGKKTFDLGLTFKTAGTHTFTVADAGNNLIKAQKTVTVLAQASAGSAPVRITKPATGTYSVKTMPVEGEASPNAKVKIFDKGVLLAEVLANQSGRFTFVTGILADGLHTFHAESNGVSSTPVTITIDTTPAQIEGVDISNKELGPGDQTDIVIRTDTDVSSVQATVGDSLADLEADSNNPGVFRGTLVAPATDGEHTINVIITDKQGNVSQPKEVGKLKVDVSLKSFATTFSVPSKVKQLAAAAGNSRVTLSWTPATSEVGIAFYRIYYGTDPANLSLVSNTKDAATTWFVPSLHNGTKYFFQVVGVDSNGVEGDNRSDFAFATPDASAGPLVLCEPEPCPEAGFPPYTPEDGPGILGVFAVSLLSGSAWQIWRRKKKAI